ncbi:hypothetical protein [Dryocola clanedunensis]|uniref:hypothetical protein n=1 Tax=Cedecea sulfonylureivorans TaxID=3051154 RepID=UPI0019269379|nr:hypothetical protein [Cedecea sulfonylureivorans]
MGEKTPNPNNNSRWTIKDLNFLEENYRKMSLVEISIRLGRTSGAVGLMAHKLGCRRSRPSEWTEEEDEIIRHYYADGAGYAHIMAILPARSEKAIFSRAAKIGVTSGIYWREEELQILSEYYPTLGTKLKEHLPGRTSGAIKLQASKLGLKFQGSDSGFCPWTEAEWALLEKNMHLSIAEQQATLFPRRSLRAVEKARGRLIKRNKLKR